MSRSFQENLALLARLAVRQGVALAPGQELIVSAETVAAPLVRLIAKEAYAAGAKNVEVLWSDPEVALARYEGSDEAVGYAPQWLVDGIARSHREGAARLGILSSDPSLLGGISPDKVAAQARAQGQARKEVSEIITGFLINWCLVGCASPAWAQRVFPNLSADEALAKLWDAIFLTSRVLEEDPEAAWVAHSERLEARVVRLNQLDLAAVHFRGPGTDLRVGLADGHLWAGGRGRAENGVLCSPNIPTEEVFTMPHRMKVDGVVCSTMPLSLRGQMVDGIQVEFKDGAAVKVSARQGEDTLKKLLETDEHAPRLGEVALVPASSKVGQSGVLFLNTLYDENAASHIALGDSYGENLQGYASMSDQQRLDAGSNTSLIHVDWMIGSREVDVDGIGKDGSATPLMRAGEWVD